MKFFYGLKSKTYFQLPVCKDSNYVKSMSGQAASLPFSIAVVFLLDRMLVHHGVPPLALISLVPIFTAGLQESCVWLWKASQWASRGASTYAEGGYVGCEGLGWQWRFPAKLK